MAWWRNIFARKSDTVAQFQLYTRNATRGAEVRVRRDGKAYFTALQHIEGTEWQPVGQEFGPYGSADEAESAAVNSAWFQGGE